MQQWTRSPPTAREALVETSPCASGACYRGHMKRTVLALALLAGACQPATSSQVVAPSSARTASPPKQQSWSLYKFGQRIGAEHATTATAADGRSVVRTTFTFSVVRRASSPPAIGTNRAERRA